MSTEGNILCGNLWWFLATLEWKPNLFPIAMDYFGLCYRLSLSFFLSLIQSARNISHENYPPFRHPDVLQTVKPRAISESFIYFWRILKLFSYSILKINLPRILCGTRLPVIFNGSLFSYFHAFASDVRCFELTFEIRLRISRFDKHAVSVFRVDESDVYSGSLTWM